MTSRKESLVKEYFKYIFPTDIVFYNYRPTWLRNPKTNKKIELDIYYPAKKIAIEVNSQFHKLKTNAGKDDVKMKVCENRGIKLFIINHPFQAIKLSIELGSNYKVPNKLYKKMKYYKPNKRAFKFNLKYNLKMERAEELQRKETEFNKRKMEIKSI